MNKYSVILIFLLLLCTVFTAGFLIGRKTINTETKIEYVKLEPVSGSIGNNQLKPDKEEIPKNPVLPIKIDTVYFTAKVDTAAIIADYMLKRSYSILALNSKEIGTLKLFPTVQYNQLSAFDYEFTPVQKQSTIYMEKVWQPFLSGSYSTLGNIGLGAGIFYHNLGFEYQYQVDMINKNNGHLLGIKYKF